MNSAPVNLQRDGIWTNPDNSANVAWSTASLLTATTFNVNAATGVNTDKGQVHSDHSATVTVAANSQRAIGTYIQQPVGDNVPYRVLASGSVKDLSRDSTHFAIAVGYAPASITGSDDAIAEPYFIPFNGMFDGLLMIPALPDGDPLEDRALCFALAIQAGTAITTLNINGQLSVQRLGTKPPTMHNAVS